MTPSHRLRNLWWPLDPTAVTVPAAAIGAVVLATTVPTLDWPYPLWTQTSAQFHQQFAWAGLIAGTAACWYATVLHPKSRIRVQAQAPRLGTAAVTRHLTVLTSWFIGAYLIALLPLVVATLFANSVGTPDPLAILSGVLAMTAAVALGYAAGTVVPSPVMVPIVAVGFYALRLAGITTQHYAAIAPVLAHEPELGQHESIPLLVFRIVLFITITITATTLASTTAHRAIAGKTKPSRRITDAATHLAAPGLLIIISLIRQPIVYTTDNQPSATCTELREIRYCVHPDNRPRLAELVHAIDPMIARFGAKPANLTRIWDQALTRQPIVTELARGLEIAWLNPDGTIQTQVAPTIAGAYACSELPAGHHTEEDTKRLTRVAADVSHYLSTGTPVGALARMPIPDVQHWIAHHQHQLHNCTLTPDQLPDAHTR